jgi:sulfate/thiosulfate transport system ATP-binding protein
VGTPEEIYQQPATPFVCEFIGKVNRLTLRAEDGSLAAGEWALADDPWSGRYRQGIAYVRPDQLHVAVPPPQPAWTARLRHIYLAGSVAHLDLHVPSLDQAMEADVASEDLARFGLQPGVELRVAPRSAVLFPLDNDTGQPVARDRSTWRPPDDI